MHELIKGTKNTYIMFRRKFQAGVIGILSASLLAVAPLALAAEPGTPELHINRFQISTDGQFIELVNRGEAVDMSKVQLVYYNNYDLTEATSSKLVSLTGELGPDGYYLVNDSAQMLCYQTTVASASLNFSTSSGLVQVIYLDQKTPGGPFVSQVLDTIAWTKSDVVEPTDVQKLPKTKDTSFLQRVSDYPAQDWEERWPSEADPCVFESSAGDTEVEEVVFLFGAGQNPPVRYVSAVSEKSDQLVNRNKGKAAPIINELLPNPASPQTDAEDEFVELYNPNSTSFDLTDFKLAFGSSSPRRYTFPEGTVLQPKEFKTFTSGDTSISLSNTKAQVWLLDPNEKVIGQSDPYSEAANGQAWVLNNGKWMWTLQPTPGAVNAIALAVTATEKGKTTAATLGISSTGSTSSGQPTSGSNPSKLDDAAPIHGGVLAVIGLGAVAYTLYEYRHDMSNKLFQLRRYLRHRQTTRGKA